MTSIVGADRPLFRKTNAYIAAIFTHTRSPQTAFKEYVEEGDIVCLRRYNRAAHRGIGLQEMQHFLWLRLTGLDDTEMDMLSSSWDAVDEGDAAYGKRRFCIPLKRLAQVIPTVNPVLARDPTAIHQPCCPVDEEPSSLTRGLYYSLNTPLPVQGLVFDKLTMRYV